jgi:hypothetical protein
MIRRRYTIGKQNADSDVVKNLLASPPIPIAALPNSGEIHLLRLCIYFEVVVKAERVCLFLFLI